MWRSEGDEVLGRASGFWGRESARARGVVLRCCEGEVGSEMVFGDTRVCRSSSL